MHALLRIVLFVAVGPFVGLLAMSVLIGMYTLVTSGRTSDFTFGPELFTPALLIISYSIGGGPALLTGIASIFVARWKSGWAGWLVIALVGAAISFIGVLVLFGPPDLKGTTTDSQLSLLLGLAGAVAGGVCAILFDGLSALLRRRVA